uniref:FBA_2 domain-containing protein n=1 Tax=Panagrellus redivivus TaxID=6233 RepID=A0A7E4WE79_PANRE
MVHSLFNCIFPFRQKPASTYPLSKYSYSFQRRLRELATPKEAYNIQLADVDDTLNFDPKVKYKFKSTMCYNQTENALFLRGNGENMEFDETILYDVYGLKLYNVDSSVFDHMLFQKLLRKPKWLTIWNSTIDSTFITECARQYGKLRQYQSVWLESCNVTTSNIFEEIRKQNFAFDEITFSNCFNFDWINSLLLLKKPLEPNIILRGTLDDIFWNVNADNFEKLFIHKNKCDNIRYLVINCEPQASVTWHDIKHRILNVFNNNFVECDDRIQEFDLEISTSDERCRFVYRKSVWLKHKNRCEPNNYYLIPDAISSASPYNN